MLFDRYCRFIHDGHTVNDVMDIPRGFAKEEVLSAQAAPLYVPCPAHIEAGWYHDAERDVWLSPEEAPAPENPGPVTTLEEARAAKLAEINAACQAALAALTPTYPERELLTFDKQEAEARAYQADSGASVPLLTSLAAGRGISVDDLAGRVIAKADAFTTASGWLIGQRQRLEDTLDACETVEAVRAIEVNYSLPGAGGAAV